MDTDAASLLTEPVAIPEEAVENVEQQVATGKRNFPPTGERAWHFAHNARPCILDRSPPALFVFDFLQTSPGLACFFVCF